MYSRFVGRVKATYNKLRFSTNTFSHSSRYCWDTFSGVFSNVFLTCTEPVCKNFTSLCSIISPASSPRKSKTPYTEVVGRVERDPHRIALCTWHKFPVGIGYDDDGIFQAFGAVNGLYRNGLWVRRRGDGYLSFCVSQVAKKSGKVTATLVLNSINTSRNRNK